MKINLLFFCCYLQNGELVWTSRDQAWIFASFYVGGLVAIPPISYLCDRFGATFVVLVGSIVNVIGSLITPFVSIELGANYLMIVRFVMGVGQISCYNYILDTFLLCQIRK